MKFNDVTSLDWFVFSGVVGYPRLVAHNNVENRSHLHLVDNDSKTPDHLRFFALCADLCISGTYLVQNL